MACQQPTTAATAAPPPIKITGAPPARPLSWANIALIGGVASCSAEALTYPLDWAKTRQQLHYNTGGKWLGLGEAVRQGVRQGGLRVVFSGMEAALLRQAIYGTLKITLYETFKARFGPGHTTKGSKAQPSMAVSVLSGAAAGGLSAAVASPTDLIKVRMQGEGMMQERRAYPSLPSAVTTIIRKEGLTGLYKGWIPTAQRAVMIGILTLPTYDLAKRVLITHCAREDGVGTHFLASFFSGMVSSLGSQPIDVIKSRIMHQPLQRVGDRMTGTLYANSFDCLLKTTRQEGVLALWKGTLPTFMRSGPWLVVFWCCYEQLKGIALASRA